MSWIRYTLLSLTCLVTFSVIQASEDGWSYSDPNGPDTWPKNYPQCGGKKQSPINIESKRVTFDGMNDLKILYLNNTALNLSNNGKAIHGSVLTNKLHDITGAGIASRFRLREFHFHLGSKNSQGSEHQINGKKSPMEMDLVHYDVNSPPKYSAVVLAVLWTLQGEDNHALDGIIEKLQNCSYKGDSVLVPSFSVKSLLPKDTTRFYRYSGSFTTPQCNESVEWILFHQTAAISGRQLNIFRSVYRDSRQQNHTAYHLVNNFRPLQALNNRVVKRNFDHPMFNCGKKTNLTGDCRQTIKGHDVFYEVEVKPCTLPVSIILKISVPVQGYEFATTMSEDQSTPIPISNLGYGASTELHFHSDGSKAGQLHITVYQGPLSAPMAFNKTTVMDEYFQVEGVCQRANCSVDSWDKHWCTSTIGYGNDSLLIGFSSILNNPCSSTNVKVKIYRYSAGKKWTLTAVNSFVDKQSYDANLTRSIVVKDQRNLVRSRRHVTMTTRWSVVKLDAHIVKDSDQSIDFMLFLQTKGIGGHYLIFDEKYIYPTNYCSSNTGSNTGRKIAIGVSVVLVTIVIIAVTGALLYRNRRSYFGHRPALIDEIDIQDADRL